MMRRNQKGRQGPLAAALKKAEETPEGRETLKDMKGAAAENIGTRFVMKQKLFSFGDDFFIKNERGEKVVRVDGKMFKLKDNLSFETMQGRELYRIKAKMVDIRETMDILKPNGQKAAVVKNAWFTPIRDKWTINIPGGDDMVAQGNMLQHEYVIRQGRHNRIAEVSKKWFRIGDAYGVEVESAFDAALILAITVVIDMMEHNGALKSNAGNGIDLL